MTHRQLFLRHLAPTSPAPLAIEIVRASGCWLYGRKKKKWLDLIAGIGVSSLGHRHPKVERAVRRQLSRYWHTMVYGECILSPQVRLAKLLADCLGNLDSTYLVNSGAEATEAAMKLAKRATARPEIVACRNAYHGSTQGAASLMSPIDFTGAYHPLLPGISHIEFNQLADLQKITSRTAAVIIETVQAEIGIRLPDPTWLHALRRRCSEVGALLIVDEIQAGCGRTGHLFAFQKYAIEPDMLLLAKGFGGGMPIGALVASRHLTKYFSFKPALGHITTFGGHPVCAAAALATFQVLTSTDLLCGIPEKEKLFLQRLQHPKIREIRHAGLWLAVDLGSWDAVRQVIEKCLSAGVLTDWFLFNNRSVRIAPPLIIEPPEIDWACEVLLQVLDSVHV